MKSQIAVTAAVFASGAITSVSLVAGSEMQRASEVPLIVADAAADFVNWENPHVHPIDLTPDRQTLLAVNTPAGLLEVFDVSSGSPVAIASIPVGIDPVSVRARSNTEAWVVNHISDSVSIVDLSSMNVIETIDTPDEPADVVFAGAAPKAFISCSQDNSIRVIDLSAIGAPPTDIDIVGEEPRAMTVSPDGSTVYAAIFESGNDSTVLGGGLTMGADAFPPNVVNDAAGPYGGLNPPPNDGALFSPPINPANPSAPGVGMIVKKNGAGQWMDDNGGDWTDLVSGANANASGRQPGWTLADHDIAAIDTGSLSVTYTTGLMNANMAIATNPADGTVAVVGTDGINEVRFEPVINGRFLRVNIAMVSGASSAVTDLNQHLSYATGPNFTPIPQNERDKSIGDPRAIVFNDAGTTAYVAGMGSDNVVVIDAAGNRTGSMIPINAGEGPTGLALDDASDRLYVMNKFASTISVIDTASNTVVDTVAFFDPSPTAIKDGRKFLYNTRLTSGLGYVSCASCHIDARTDRLSWDLGNPEGDMKPFDQNCFLGGCEDWHPMKGPMSTQTLQDIIGLEPHHWRADRFGIEEFNDAFETLLGDDTQLTPAEMQQFEDFLATICLPPNPFRNLDNSLPTNLPLDGHFTTGRFAPAGQPLPNGDAQAGLLNYRTGNLDGVQCVTCHTLPTGAGPDLQLVGFNLVEIPPGPNGERHIGVVSLDGSTNVSIKIPQLRTLYEKTGFNTTQAVNTAGIGVLHDGSVDSIERFLAEPVFSLANVQELADMTAFMLAFSGSDLPDGSISNPFEPLGPPSNDTHAAVGRQASFDGVDDAADMVLLADLAALADATEIGLIAKGIVNGEARGYRYEGVGFFAGDRAGEVVTQASLLLGVGPGSELTFTAVPFGSQTRLGIDRDRDGDRDRDELDSCADPSDALSTVANSTCCPADVNNDGSASPADFTAWLGCFNDPGSAPYCDRADVNDDGNLDPADFTAWLAAFNNGCP